MENSNGELIVEKFIGDGNKEETRLYKKQKLLGKGSFGTCFEVIN